MNLLSLSIFVAIVDSGNLSQAARALKMSRANVSYHLFQLENALGAELLRRTPQGNELTEVGERIYHHAANIVNESALLQETVQSGVGELSGKLSLSVPTGYGQLVVGPWLIEFKKIYPGIVLEVRFDNFVDNLVRDGVDVAISVRSEPPPLLVVRDLGPLRYVVSASSHWAAENAMPRSMQDLADVPIVTTGGITGRAYLKAVHNDRASEMHLHPTLLSRNFPYLRECILAGMGVGIVPDYVVKDLVHAGSVVTSMDDHLLTLDAGQMYLLYTPNRYRSRVFRTLLDFLMDKLEIARPIRKDV
ncbi:LysR family transcriptional regulator [Pusillimonas sp. MFBS29]|uniref:LysR family transcriptional regulator n=1 Tax=Pusillimonas sp. MFBS29 TaxID=2886690 RepID=UPI001D1087A3|nr:LysR family transcriptional regulator [Pusillimonas sp. MFBS29]MCC2596973.1 LysR family transcriptional regulator [Pusillimonas sp. MFBS29]